MRLFSFSRRLSKNEISGPCEHGLVTPESSVKGADESDTTLVSVNRNSFSIEHDLQQVVCGAGDPLKAVQTLNSSRSRIQSTYYVFDSAAFEASLEASLASDAGNYDIFSRPGSITHSGCVHVLPALVETLKSRICMGKIKAVASEVFSPNLDQLQTDILLQTKSFITQLFPYEGCSLRKGPKLDSLLAEVDNLRLIISVRVLISLLPGGLLTGAHYEQFVSKEEASFAQDNFYKLLPMCVPSDSHPVLIQQFLDLVITVWRCLCEEESVDQLMDLCNSASALCFHTPPDDGSFEKDVYFYKQFYGVRNAAFQRLVVAYLKAQGEHVVYPPLEYQTSRIEYGLVVSVPKHRVTRPNLYGLASGIASSQASVYSQHDALYFDEGVFLRRLRNNPYSTLRCNVTDTSLNYLKVFDSDSELLDHVRLGNDPALSSRSCQSSTMVEDSVRVSKMVISRWFVDTWKYETAMGSLSSTFVFELSQKIGQVSWLVITCDGQPRGVAGDMCVDPELANLKQVNQGTSIIDMVSDQDGMFVISEAEEVEHENNHGHVEGMKPRRRSVRKNAVVTPQGSPERVVKVPVTPQKGKKRRHSERDESAIELVIEEEIPMVSMLKTSPRCTSFKDLIL